MFGRKNVILKIILRKCFIKFFNLSNEIATSVKTEALTDTLAMKLLMVQYAAPNGQSVNINCICCFIDEIIDCFFLPESIMKIKLNTQFNEAMSKSEMLRFKS